LGTAGLMLFSGVVFPLAFKAILIEGMRPFLREAAGGLCVGCGYDLRGSEGRCPECGRGY
jgi:predicted amidophosphoribosyltransferase